MGTSRYRHHERTTFALAALLALTILACLAQLANAQRAGPSRQAATAKKHKPKQRPVRCKRGQARVQAGKRTLCVRNSLPVVHVTPQAAAAGMALRLELGTARDRRGRRSPSLTRLLKRFGPNTSKKLEQTIATELAKGNALIRAEALTGRTARASATLVTTPIAYATAKCGTPEELERARKEAEEAPPGEKEKAQKELAEFEKGGNYKNGDLDATLDLANGAVKLGIDLKAKGIRLDMSMRICGEGAVQVDNCPTAEGKVKGSDKSEMEISFKVSEGAKVLTARSFKITGETTLEAQTGDDGKLDYYDIKHVYEFVGTIGGSREKFGPVTADFTYIGEARIDMRSANQKPPPAVVDVRMAVAGVDPHELIAAEIELAKKAQTEADKEFSAVVEKATSALRRAEEHWLKPNECAQIHFEPASETLTLTKNQTGTVKSRAEAKGGGAPQRASWTLGAQQNATFTPGGGEGNPLSTSYTVTKAGKGAIVSATFKATSKAGVADATWKQKTDLLIHTISGTFSGRFEDKGELIEWTGSATFTAILHENGATVLQLSSGEVDATASGTTDFECEQTGKETITPFSGSTFTVSGETEPVQYTIDVGYGFPGRMKANLFNCHEPSSNGLPYEPDLGLAAVLSGDSIHNGPTDLLKPSPDGTTFEGSATGFGSEPTEHYSWSWSFKVTS